MRPGTSSTLLENWKGMSGVRRGGTRRLVSPRNPAVLIDADRTCCADPLTGSRGRVPRTDFEEFHKGGRPTRGGSISGVPESGESAGEHARHPSYSQQRCVNVRRGRNRPRGEGTRNDEYPERMEQSSAEGSESTLCAARHFFRARRSESCGASGIVSEAVV